MISYNEEYYIMFTPKGDDQIYIKPQERSADRKFRYRKLNIEDGPLFFENCYRDEDKNKWPSTDILVEGGGFLATSTLCDKLRDYDVDFMQIYPAIYVDDNDNYREDYFYIGFYERLDCLDIKKSEIEDIEFDEKDIDDDDPVSLEVSKFSLSDSVLGNISEENRLMFKIGQCSKPYIFVHQTVVDIFLNYSYTGVQFIKVSDFKEGQQYI